MPDESSADSPQWDNREAEGHTGPGRFAAGDAARREVLGDDHVERSWAGADSFTRDHQQLITEYAWGGVWARDGLDRRTRSCITLAMLAAMRIEHEFEMHVGVALRLGVTPDEIKEVLLQVGLYAGQPAANRAFAIAQQVLAHHGSTGT